MHRTLFAALGCALLSFGCEPAPPVFRELAVHPSFKMYQKEAIAEAAKVWFSRVPQAKIRIYTGYGRGMGSIVPTDDCEEHAGFTDGSGAEPIVTLCSSANFATTKVVALHELGHVLGQRSDHLEEGNVMAPTCDPLQPLTNADVDYVLDGRGDF